MGKVPVYSVADPDQDFWDWIRIRILTLINDPVSTFLDV
jgi:hypothetical protein